MKAVVLAAGLGTRMRRPDAGAVLDSAQTDAADRGAKGLVPFGGRPFLDYVISGLVDGGVREVCLVVGPQSPEIRGHYAASPPRRVRLAFAVQESPRGTADALLAAEPFADGEAFLALNADNLYPVPAIRALLALGEPGLPVFEKEDLLARSNFPRERVERYAVLELGEDGYLERIVEKPPLGSMVATPGREVLLSLNLWRFSAAIFEACRRVPLSARGEYELPQAVGFGIAALGLRFRAVRSNEGVLDLSGRGDVAAVAERLEGIPACP